MKSPIIKWENFVLNLFRLVFVFYHPDVTGNIRVIAIKLYNDCIVVIAHPYRGNVVFIVHFYIITIYVMLPPGHSSDFW